MRASLEVISKLGIEGEGSIAWAHGMASPHRRAVGADSTAAASCEAPPARRAAPGRPAGLFRGHSLDPLDGRAVERTAAAIREHDDLLAPPAAVGGARGARGALARLSQPAQRSPEDSLGRVLRRR